MYPGLIAEKNPDRIAYRMARSGETVSYAELDARSNQAARALREIGLRQGDAIAFCLENHPRFFELCWAAQRSGLQYTAISSRLTAPEVEYIVKDCGARVFVTSQRKRELAEELAGPLAGLDARFMMDGSSEGYENRLSRTTLSPRLAAEAMIGTTSWRCVVTVIRYWKRAKGKESHLTSSGHR